MLPDRVSNPGPLTYESGVLPIALRGPAKRTRLFKKAHAVFDQGLLDGGGDGIYHPFDGIF